MKFVKSGTTLTARTSPNKFTSSLSKKGTVCTGFVTSSMVQQQNIYKMVCAVKVRQAEIETKVDFVTKKVELVENAMEAKMDAKIAELRRDQEEIEKRRTNLIIYEIAESISPDSGERKRDDEHKVRSIFRKLQVQEPDVKSASRLGKKQKGNVRPVKVVFSSESNKKVIMNRVQSLRISKQKEDAEVLKDIHIAPDMTQRQREERRGLMKELVNREQEGEKDLVIRNGRLIQKKLFGGREIQLTRQGRRENTKQVVNHTKKESLKAQSAQHVTDEVEVAQQTQHVTDEVRVAQQ